MIGMYRYIVIVLTLLPVCFGASWGAWNFKHYEKHKKSIKCYQCAYSPGKTVYKEQKVAVEIKQRDPHHWDKYVTKTEYKTRLVPVKKPGGWDKCQGPFDYGQAKEYGVDVWECNDNCYTRIDRHGNVLRGCYKGEFGVDPKKYGCNVQAGQLYCFCKGNKCNNKAVPSRSNINFDNHDSWGVRRMEKRWW